MEISESISLQKKPPNFGVVVDFRNGIFQYNKINMASVVYNRGKKL
jgi:hypothetical protein